MGKKVFVPPYVRKGKLVNHEGYQYDRENLSNKKYSQAEHNIAKYYEGQKVKPKYQGDYGKVYSAEAAKVAAIRILRAKGIRKS